MNKELIKENRASQFNAFVKFLGCLVILCTLSFMSIFLFLESYTIQHKNIENDILAYKEILNKQEELKVKIDTIYYQMSLFNTGKVRNNIFLGNYISKNIQDARDKIGVDSTSAFKHYTFLLIKLDSMLLLKNDIIKIEDKERFAYRELQGCVKNMSKIKTELSKDPTRSFQSK